MKKTKYYPLRKGYNDALQLYTNRNSARVISRSATVSGDEIKVCTTSASVAHSVKAQTSFPIFD